MPTTGRRTLMRYDGTDPEPITITDAVAWVKRVREDLRIVEANLRQFPNMPAQYVAQSLEQMVEFAHDACGAAAELESIAEATAARYGTPKTEEK